MPSAPLHGLGEVGKIPVSRTPIPLWYLGLDGFIGCSTYATTIERHRWARLAPPDEAEFQGRTWVLRDGRSVAVPVREKSYLSTPLPSVSRYHWSSACSTRSNARSLSSVPHNGTFLDWGEPENYVSVEFGCLETFPGRFRRPIEASKEALAAKSAPISVIIPRDGLTCMHRAQCAGSVVIPDSLEEPGWSLSNLSGDEISTETAK
ncbi:hypothetical protein P175DRAFT_0535638 [Aspergillus ochraceoroseus IBT 24754]|uniref:Uncharacterized protein n=1 Tax=Aspergillus ochraceoroseus IBT 24754 TaxID=1392256 RepID=A0A2T5LNR3_9EURO|nr:uncharacterized protein P175DRAFT_0535638 [Aspergillus ochraceoroseus IBT 24754]PTU17895.1 hypothetical protein P175DRAFT_0535638 [Aspergillus ochraceoroseus IBT 24754]